ncbi:MAG: DUF368 domain-containing protein [Bacteroidetes bacterium]|nr:DUF368 domain-containing protein [Bacteroidota bacterium]
MGVAETIPGVSGGTIAFITGIYEELINSIKAFHPSLITTFRKDGFGAVWSKINGNFLIFLLGGMIIGLGVGLVAVDYFLTNYPPIVWAFFFGLIIASIIFVGKQIKDWKIGTVFIFMIGAAIAYGISILPIAQANDNLIFIFFCGAVAVSALLLPGISGSFILLILGMYQFILHDTLKDGVLVQRDVHAMIIMGTFGIGMIVGLALFSRVLSWALRNHHNFTLALLAGFMLGALNKLWPWRIPTVVMDEEGQVHDFITGMSIDKIIKEVNVLPAQYVEQLGEPSFVVPVIISVIVGFALVMVLDSKSEVKL